MLTPKTQMRRLKRRNLHNDLTWQCIRSMCASFECGHRRRHRRLSLKLLFSQSIRIPISKFNFPPEFRYQRFNALYTYAAVCVRLFFSLSLSPSPSIFVWQKLFWFERIHQDLGFCVDVVLLFHSFIHSLDTTSIIICYIVDLCEIRIRYYCAHAFVRYRVIEISVCEQ